MKKLERQANIMEYVANEATLEVSNLAKIFKVSGETIRRDLAEMEVRGLVHKIHGGVISPQSISDSSYQTRMKTNAEGKRRISKTIAKLIKNGNSVLIETGTTATFIAQALRNHRNLMVVTNSVDVARILAFGDGNQVFMAGGQLSSEDGAALSQTAIDYIRQFRLDYAIFSVAGFDLEDGLTDFKMQEAEFTRAAIARAQTRILALDSSKWARRAPFKVVELTDINFLITNAQPIPDYQYCLDQANVKIMIA